MSDPPSLDAAYALGSSAEATRLYRDWADSYDDSFATRTGYRAAGLVAAAFAAAGGRGPVLDVGAGTGLLGLALADLGIGPVDGLDLSPEMLDRARAKGCYRGLYQADLTAALPVLPVPYAGLVSSGTFTIGHLGADALPGLLALAAPGARVALSVSPKIWPDGFDDVLKGMHDLRRVEEVIYLRPDPGHEADRTFITSFRLP